MKKLFLFISLLSAGIIGCNKELPNDESSAKSQDPYYPGGIEEPGLFVIYNCTGIGSDSKRIVYPLHNDDMALIMNVERKDDVRWDLYTLWQIERMNESLLKFVSNNHTYFTQARALDVDFNNPDDDGNQTMTAVIYKKYGGYNQCWFLVGDTELSAEGNINRFKGVIVNKRTGKMLQLDEGYVSPHIGNYLVISRQYAGSDEEKHFSEYGNFDGYCSSGNRNTIWVIHRL